MEIRNDANRRLGPWQNSNAVACPRLYSARAEDRVAAPLRDREEEEKNIFKSVARRLELESAFRRTRVCASEIATRFAERSGRCAALGSRAWTRKKYENFVRKRHEPDENAFVVRCFG